MPISDDDRHHVNHRDDECDDEDDDERDDEDDDVELSSDAVGKSFVSKINSDLHCRR